MTELDYMKESLARLYDELERLVANYRASHETDDRYRDVTDIVVVNGAPNDALCSGGTGYHCKGGKWHGEWRGESS